MLKRIGLILACGVLGSLFASSVQALPVSSAPAQMAAPAVTLGAGLLRSWLSPRPLRLLRSQRRAYYGFPPPPPPVMVGVPRGCPWGFYMGPYGRCYQY